MAIRAVKARVILGHPCIPGAFAFTDQEGRFNSRRHNVGPRISAVNAIGYSMLGYRKVFSSITSSSVMTGGFTWSKTR
jgi:hypothetical protein